ncbi:histidine--tRNA ligase [bacterium C-53]|nr:histidine--tRNA ligase [Lachnospiraceae bacterium]NBI03377.1 histidine--tRNA ligase [Lachnospiraceae bacterium]RKJ09910.1 histidine--tRNA ligase [bacterium C-53]
MALKKKPVTGMKDILPEEMQIRDYVIRLIKETYGNFGFSSIETPCVEHIENLCSKQGGENEKLIFKILKRGEKLNLDAAEKEEDLVDSGLRYDLTVPLSRYYSNNANNLPTPFKALQMGSVFRADRPQKGRFRQFMQCDIDILGDATYLAEVELILATTTLLGKLGFSGFKVRINDRRFLKAMASYCGFPQESYDQVFIILDKLDKIGPDGVLADLVASGFSKESAERYLELFQTVTPDAAGIRMLRDTLGDHLPEDAAENLLNIISSVNATRVSEFDLAFDPALVRGMSYYTGTIFEIEMEEFGSSVAGGGRYDEMIGKFTGMQTPACGFSIGFERIITILLDRGFQVPGASDNQVFLLERGVAREKMCAAMKEAMELREKGVRVLVAQMNKNKKFQKEQLMKAGFTEFKDIYKD